MIALSLSAPANILFHTGPYSCLGSAEGKPLVAELLEGVPDHLCDDGHIGRAFKKVTRTPLTCGEPGFQVEDVALCMDVTRQDYSKRLHECPGMAGRRSSPPGVRRSHWAGPTESPSRSPSSHPLVQYEIQRNGPADGALQEVRQRIAP